MTGGARHHHGVTAHSPAKGNAADDGVIPFLCRRNALECLLGAIGVALMCWIGESFYKVAGTLAAPLWPSSGLALGLLLLRGWRLFPAISLGTITATTTFGDPHLFSLFGSVANTLESLIGWFLMVRVFGFSNSMSRVRDIIVLMAAGAPWGTLLSAVICTLGLVAVGIVKPDGIPLSSLLFWTGNVLGILIFTPLFLRLSQRWKEGIILRWQTGQMMWLLFLTIIVLLGFSVNRESYAPLAYLSFPFLMWLAFAWRSDVTVPLALVVLLDLHDGDGSWPAPRKEQPLCDLCADDDVHLHLRHHLSCDYGGGGRGRHPITFGP